ncbi:hypothetical protein KUCAC02_020549 [Chaenocephalus aceratus]|nr:hypothetical protein KUCAC02_020549 [Chaenocephalus aceratus]
MLSSNKRLFLRCDHQLIQTASADEAPLLFLSFPLVKSQQSFPFSPVSQSHPPHSALRIPTPPPSPLVAFARRSPHVPPSSLVACCDPEERFTASELDPAAGIRKKSLLMDSNTRSTAASSSF